MNEHEHEHPHPSHLHEHKSPTMGAVAGSIIIGAVLISASIFYNTRVIIKELPALKIQAVAAPTAAGSQPAAQAPAGPVSVTSRSDEAVLGSKDAKVTVVEFADFQCPYCQKFFIDTFSQIKSQYIDTGKIKYVYRHFPLTAIHVNAQISAVAAECANRQGKFWEYHNLLYKNGQADGTGLALSDLKKYADSFGLNKGTLGFGKDKFNQCLDSSATLKIVQDDTAEGTKDGVSGTPTFFVNGQKIVGAVSFSKFQETIDNALKK